MLSYNVFINLRHKAHVAITMTFYIFTGAIALRTFHESAGTITRESAIVERSLISAKQVYSKKCKYSRTRTRSRSFSALIAQSRITGIFRIGQTIAVLILHNG